MSESFYFCLISGLAIIVALYKFLRRKTRKDPLPERDPACIWHSIVKKVYKVYDGDTIFAYVKGHNPIDNKPTGIRIRGIDTPEIRDPNPSVRKKAQNAKAFVESEINKARKIHLYNISMDDKYGRMLATVFCDRKDIAKMLLEQKLAKAYDGGKKQKW